ncbi:hypothetical protein J2W91_004114 [Paenibacillus amylolyticus]|uniref:Uncharacterized protein n=1 Tax=Paenibacillus amylolyticus TaxID=1451 RepID=A0AAP5H4B8_PAEAM|nr:hypothetical protein [Paenibacillus amylolyticus]MDR6725612.1 hypothetical protein [Paenibacillus amylolyticus]
MKKQVLNNKETSHTYIVVFTFLYGVTLLAWPLVAFAMGMSFAAPTSPEFQVASDLLFKILMSYPISVIAAIIGGWASYRSERYIFPYWMMQLPLLWIIAFFTVDRFGKYLNFLG